jgi:dihydroorotase
VIDPASGRDAVCDLLIENGIIRQIGNVQANLSTDQIIDATGKIVTPGFIDLHTHLREPGQEYKETVASGMAAAAAGGFTTICAMPNTTPVNDNKAVTRLILEQARNSPHRGLRVLPVGAVTKGQQGKELTEMGELFDAGCVAFSDDGLPVATSEMMRRALEYAKLFDVPIIDHCEDLSLSAGGVMFEGAVSFSMGLKGIPAASETIIVARDIALAESTGGRVHLAHISTTGSVRLIREAKRRGIAVTAETCPHYFTLTDQEVRGFNADAKMKPPLAGEADRDEIRAGLADGTIDAIATDHAPHAPHEKEQTMDRAPFGIIGLETALPLSLRLVEDGVLSLSEMIRKWTENPARILKKPLGRLTVGEVADVTIIDPACQWTVTSDLLKSKSKNSPFIDQTMWGRPIALIASGRQVSCH